MDTERRVRRALRATAATVRPRPALTAIRTRIADKTAAPGLRPGAAAEQAVHLEGATAMTISIPKSACGLHVGDHIVRHPDHPDKTVNLRVAGEPSFTRGAKMTIPYVDQTDGGEGVLVLDPMARVDIDLTPAGEQHAMALVLAELTGGRFAGLTTVASWTIDDRGLSGLIQTYLGVSPGGETRTDWEADEKALTAWAAALGTPGQPLPIECKPYRTKPWVALTVRTKVGGVPVRVWTTKPAPAESATTESEATS